MRFLYLTLEDVSGEGRETKRVTTKIGISELEAYYAKAGDVIAEIVSRMDTQLTKDLKGKHHGAMTAVCQSCGVQVEPEESYCYRCSKTPHEGYIPASSA